MSLEKAEVEYLSRFTVAESPGGTLLLLDVNGICVPALT